MLLRNAGIIALISSAGVLLAGDFWQDKQPSDWTDKEVQKLLTKSPWAKDAILVMSAGRGSGPLGDGAGLASPGTGGGGKPMSINRQGPAGAGLDGGAMGGPAGEESPGGMPAVQKVATRWDSAAPLRAAATRTGTSEDAKKVADWSQEFYVVTVSGFPSTRTRGGDDPAAFDPARLKGATALKIKGKGALPPARVETSTAPAGRSISFLFPRAAAISLDDKELSFETALGPSQIKVKFTLKDMLYHGKLEL